MNVKVYGAFAAREEPDEYHMLSPQGFSQYLFVHFYNPVNIKIGAEFVKTKKNACIIYTPSFYQEYYAEETPFINDYIRFFPDDLSFVTNLGLPVNEVFYIRNNPRLKGIIMQITWMLTDVLVDHSNEMKAHLFDALNEVRKSMIIESPKTRRDAVVRKRLAELRRQVERQPYDWSVERMAQTFYFTRSRFTVIYRQQFGASPKEDLMRFTIEYAEKLLLQSDFTVTEIATKCGYTNPENFIRAFRNYRGVTPLCFRKQHLK